MKRKIQKSSVTYMEKYDADFIKNIVNCFIKNMKEIEISLFKCQPGSHTAYFPDKYEISDLKESNMVIIKKDKQVIFEMFEIGFFHYLCIHLFNENMKKDDYDIILKIFDSNNIKLPLPYNMKMRDDFIISILSFSNVILFFFIGNYLNDLILYELKYSIFVFLIIFFGLIPIVFLPVIYIYIKQKKFIKNELDRIQDIKLL